MKVILKRDQLVRLIEKLREMIQDKKINPKEFILINKNRNGIKYIDLKDVFKEDFIELDKSTLTMIERVLNDLKMNEEEEIVIKGSYFQFGCLFNLLLKEVN